MTAQAAKTGKVVTFAESDKERWQQFTAHDSSVVGSRTSFDGANPYKFTCQAGAKITLTGKSVQAIYCAGTAILGGAPFFTNGFPRLRISWSS